MYICEITGKVSKPGEGLHKTTVQRRDRTYTKKVKNEETNKWEDVECGRGWEIVRELNLSLEGVELWSGWTAEEREIFLKNTR
jgi:hypothetical protein